jgi:hypothetical protein
MSSATKYSYVTVILWGSCALMLGCGSRDIGAKRQALAAFTISGTVYGGGEPLANVNVSAVLDGTQTSVASATTNASGTYSLGVDAGTYDLVIDTPAGSGYSDDQVQNIVVSGNVRQDIVLIAESNFFQVSGTLTGHGGNPVANANVYLYSGPRSFAAKTDANGAYSLAIPAGTYLFRFYHGTPYSPHAPQGYYYCDKHNVAVSGDTVVDYALPVNRLSGKVLGEDGVAVGDAQIQLWGGYSATNEGCYGDHWVKTDASGAYTAFVFHQTGARVYPPTTAPYGNIQESFAVSGDTQRDFTVPREVILSGTVTGYGGEPVANQLVRVYRISNYIHTYTDDQGAYSLGVPPGTYNVEVHRNAVSPNAPSNYNCVKRNVVVSDGTTTNLVLPAVRVAGRVLGAPGDVPIPDTSVRFITSHAAGDFSCNSDVSLTTNASGQYSLLTFQGSSTMPIYPPQSSGYGAEARTATWTGDTDYDITLSAGVTVSGVITGHQGKPVAGTYVYLYRDPLYLYQLTDSEGRYSIVVAPNTYNFQVYMHSAHSPNAPSSYYYCRNYNHAIAADTQMDFTLPVAGVRGNITDFNGAPVPGTQVELPHMGYSANGTDCWQSGYSPTSDASGRYSMMLLQGTRSFTIRPPGGSGFLPVSISNVDLGSDLLQDVRLQHPDLEPPVIVSGPTVIHLSDTSVSINWVTDEPSDSTVHYGLNGLTETIHRDELVTTHSVTLVGLDPTSPYTYRVSSTDEEGNGPTTSDVFTFTTVEPPGDIVPPAIINGPIVAFVDQTNALIQWQTDEPTTSVVHFGLTSALGQTVTGPAGLYVQSHSQLLTGLQPNTTYYVKVESSDPDGNGPAVSDIISFTTTQIPDTEPPVLIGVPNILGVTDTTVTITWETNEVATSGVSYTDGQAYNLVTDNALVTAHTVTITQLTPNTTYTFTTSSRDAVGNGPTLGAPIRATTAAEPDITSPNISDISTAATLISAEIEWTTDEPANSSVIYSAAAAVAEHSVSAVALVTAHSLFLQGLYPGTTYHFAVISTDIAGNQASSDWRTFTTDSCVHPAPPGASQHCTSECPCSDGGGDCDSEDECLPWLTCVRDVGARYGWRSDVDVCEATCHPSALGTSTYCRAGCPCEAGEGDCDSDAECAPGLRCIFDVGANYGWGADVDVCEATCHPSANGGWDYCSAGCPCNAGEGDCDSDAECASGFVCAHDAGARYGWSSEVDVCEAPTSMIRQVPANDNDIVGSTESHTNTASSGAPDEHAPRRRTPTEPN